ncbi:hypothetical protein [Endozoicomonas sp. SESOKO1]|uniref:hypothetical protein n=1 Tax=Endozoicomonas sp. SESOKO1 TaxID=2828742 RepID=UPI0021481B6F|nr:hypothetical protein [Endozoicomonas sp. SESOKO1]
MARKTTTKAFREKAVAQVLSGKTEEQVAIELGVEIAKVRSWYRNATKDGVTVTLGIFDHPLQEQIAPKEDRASVKGVEEKLKKLEFENRCLRELVSLNTQWISRYMAMQSDVTAGA